MCSIWDVFLCLPGGNTGKRDGHAEISMFVACGEKDTLQMPKRASAMCLKGCLKGWEVGKG